MTQQSPLHFGAPFQLSGGPGVDLRPNWNADSQSVIFERLEGGMRRLYRVKADGTGLTALDLCNLPGTNATGRAAFFGQDDFAFVSDRSGQPAVWRCDLQLGKVTPLTRADVPCYGPALALQNPARLLFFQKQGEAYHVYMQGTGAPATQLTRAAGTQDQPWPFPDGRAFVYHAREGKRQVVYQQATEPAAPPVLLSDRDEGTEYVTPYPSPDGTWIAFASAAGGGSQVWVMRADGTGRQQVTFGAPHGFPAWSPDGTRLVFVRGEPTADRPNGHLWSSLVS